MTTEPEWGYWLDQPGGTWIMLPKLPLTRAGFNNPPFTVTRPDGKVLNVVEKGMGARVANKQNKMENETCR
jgi:hypothetical protein